MNHTTYFRCAHYSPDCHVICIHNCPQVPTSTTTTNKFTVFAFVEHQTEVDLLQTLSFLNSFPGRIHVKLFKTQTLAFVFSKGVSRSHASTSMSGRTSPLRYPESWLLVRIQTFAAQQTRGQVRAKPTPHQALIPLTAHPVTYSHLSQSPFKPDARQVLQREIPLRRSRHRKCLFSRVSDSLSLFSNLGYYLTTTSVSQTGADLRPETCCTNECVKV